MSDQYATIVACPPAQPPRLARAHINILIAKERKLRSELVAVANQLALARVPISGTSGERIAWYRRRRGLSQRVLAELVGRTEDWLSKVENGRIQVDRLSVLRKLAAALQVNLVSLLDLEEEASE